jgi:hypothetical protein
MPTKLSAYAETQLMPSLFKGAACPPPPTGHKIRLYKTPVTETGGGTEVNGGGYTPIAVSFGPPAQVGSSEDYQCVNPARIESAEATSAWDLDVAYGVYDAVGNLLSYGDVAKEMTPAVGVAIGDRWKAEPEKMYIKITGGLPAAIKIALLNWLVGGQSFTPLTAAKLALYDAAGAELSGGGYSRLDISLGTLTDDGAGSHYYANTNALTATFSGSVTVGQIGLLTATGTVIQKGVLPQSKTFGPGVDFSAPASALKFMLG